uniref:Homeobox domain-containing protein n=1 Tax=Bionectria ochroleuca TaxID=29856 RepID=A0A8H7TSN5_BIOOC
MATEMEQAGALTHTEHVVGTPGSMSDPNSATPGSAMKQSPSPGSSVPGHSSASRRPPRKSTLTQQQKNQKRQRATQDQLATLELEFNKNPTPTALVRERIAEEINMTERSVQIWFQNRRAKIKNLAKKSLETGEDIDSIPESMRAYLAMQAMESGKGLGGNYFGRTGLSPSGTAVCSWEIPTLKF